MNCNELMVGLYILASIILIGGAFSIVFLNNRITKNKNRLSKLFKILDIGMYNVDLWWWDYKTITGSKRLDLNDEILHKLIKELGYKIISAKSEPETLELRRLKS